MDGISERRPFGREALFKQVGALVGATMLWLLSLVSLAPSQHRPAVVAQGASLIVVAVVMTVALPWHRLPDALKVVPPMIALLIGVRLQVLLDAGLWSESTYLLMPMFWLAAFGTRTEVGAGAVLAAVALFGQALIWSRGATGWGDAAVLAPVAAGVAFAIHAVFQRVRTRADRHPALQSTDALTGLPGRVGWEERVPQLLSQGAAARQPVCVMILHLDRFREFADHYGRKEADRLVRGGAAMWRDHLRKTDLIARLNGTDFAALLMGCSVEAAAGIARRLATVLDAPLTFSLGIAEWNGEESAAALSRRADAALERAKRAGGDRVEFGTAEAVRGDRMGTHPAGPSDPASTSSGSPARP